MYKTLILLFLTSFLPPSTPSDISTIVFGNVLDGMPAAFGDFNSDELTDVFVLRNGDKTLEILLASDQEPLLRPANLTCSFPHLITSIVPGDFDGDVFMDILVTTISPESHHTHVHIIWGAEGPLNCPKPQDPPLLELKGQPLTIDYNQDMIIDLFGSDTSDYRTFWVFNHSRTPPEAIRMSSNHQAVLTPIREPHSNAFLDLNSDFYPDLMITTKENFEIWHGGAKGFKFAGHTKWPLEESQDGRVGQALYLDVELKSQVDLIVPVCFDRSCKNSSIMVNNGEWYDLKVVFRDPQGVQWGFVNRDYPSRRYTDTITLRGGDFNMDGYPDLLATLLSEKNEVKSFLLLNTECSTCGKVNRTFKVDWKAFIPFFNETVMGVFYDFYQDGILDVIFVMYDKGKDAYTTGAFKNIDYDYDANFVKVMVLTGLENREYPISPGSLGKKKRTYGTNLPGPSISYTTTTQDGSPMGGVAAQLPQSAHFSLNLPYTTFGLGRTPNFVDQLTIGVAGKSRSWTQIIPNSQMVVIPNPIKHPSKWKAQLFVTPSKLILLSAAALTATCGLITAIIAGLYWKERREDKIERLQEAHRFHFDAM